MLCIHRKAFCISHQGEKGDCASRRSVDKFIRDHSCTPVPCSSRSVTPIPSSEKQGASTSTEVAPQSPSRILHSSYGLYWASWRWNKEVERSTKRKFSFSHWRYSAWWQDGIILYRICFINIFSAFFFFFFDQYFISLTSKRINNQLSILFSLSYFIDFMIHTNNCEGYTCTYVHNFSKIL